MTGIEFLGEEWRKLGQQKENNVLESIYPVVDASFNSLKHFVGLQNVLKKIYGKTAKYTTCNLNNCLQIETIFSYLNSSKNHL